MTTAKNTSYTRRPAGPLPSTGPAEPVQVDWKPVGAGPAIERRTVMQGPFRMPAPDKLRIPYEDFDSGRFTSIGRLPDGTQFMAFVTGAFPSGQEYYLGEDWQTKKRWLAVIHLFDADGNHVGSESRLGAFDVEGREVAGEKAFGHLEAMFAELIEVGEPEFCDVWVKPFAVELDGVTHGLIYEHYVEEHGGERDEGEYVMLQPHDIMFHPPWDSGEYST